MILRPTPTHESYYESLPPPSLWWEQKFAQLFAPETLTLSPEQSPTQLVRADDGWEVQEQVMPRDKEIDAFEQLGDLVIHKNPCVSRTNCFLLRRVDVEMFGVAAVFIAKLRRKNKTMRGGSFFDEERMLIILSRKERQK